MYKNLPNFSVTLKTGNGVDTVTLELEPKDYLKETQVLNFYMLTLMGMDFTPVGDDGKNDEYWLLGLILLKKYFTVYDASNMRIGFAPSRPDVTPFNQGYFLTLFVFLGLFFFVVGYFYYSCIHKPRMEKIKT